MSAARYEVLATLPPGAGNRTRLAWLTSGVGFRKAVVLREVPASQAASMAGPPQEGVLPLLDLIELDGRRWAVYDFVAGATFAEVAEAHFSVERLPSLGLIGRMVVDACRAIHRVHAWADPLGLTPPQAHGGLSDQAVFVGFDGVARVLDLNAPRLGRFVAPEAARDARADVFSLGALMHFGTTRFLKAYAATMARAPSPLEFPPPSSVHPEAKLKLDAVVIRALMPSPASRFSSAAQLANEIEGVLGASLFSHQQVADVLLPLFGDRIAALKDLVDPKKHPPPRASAPRPPPRMTGSAFDALGAMDVSLDGGAPAGIEDSPTQSHIVVKPGPPIPTDYDPQATTPGRSLPPQPVLGQSAEEKALARGQEKISTGELPALQAPGLGDDIEQQPTNIKQRVVTGDEEGAYEDPKKKAATEDLDPPEAKPSRRGRRVVLALLALGVVGGAAAAVGRPDLVEQLKARLRKPDPTPIVEEIALQDVAADAGEAEDDADGGEEDAEPAASVGVDSGVRDAGADKHPAPVTKKKKKKRRR